MATLGATLTTTQLEIPSVNDFRLTLETAVPVSTSDQLAKSTLYLTPYLGNRIALYNGTTWDYLASAEVSLNLDTAEGGGACTANKNYDIWAYNNGGTLTLEALVWTNNTTRATAIVRQDGVWCKTGALTRRLVGTIRITAVAGDTADAKATRFVWNANNRVLQQMDKHNGTAHNYTTNAWRAWNNDQANSQVEFVYGLQEDHLLCWAFHCASNTTGLNVVEFIGGAFDATNTSSTRPYYMVTNAANVRMVMSSLTTSQPVGIGYHFFCGVQNSDATGTTTWQEMSVSGVLMA